jgi:SAM-dependent methyltransferase
MAGPEDITLFSSVDRTKEPDFFKRFLDEGNKLPGIIASKPIILAGLQLTEGEQVLDAGCGMGDDTFEIAQIVGSQGRAVGIDVSETMILEARRRAVARGRLSKQIAHHIGIAEATVKVHRSRAMQIYIICNGQPSVR